VLKRMIRLLARVVEVSKQKGICYIFHVTFRRIIFWSKYYHCKVIRSLRTFTFQGETYNYCNHSYNNSWLNERTVEVPIIWKMVKNHRGKKILEVGNVLSHYFFVNHDIVDKYEKAEGVINQDVVDFQPSNKYDLIVSISTLEHVGWDETPREHTKILRALQNLKRFINSEGRIVITLPLGYNPEMDKLLKEEKIHFTKQYCLKRISKDNKWAEVDWNDIHDIKYGGPFLAANGLVIGIIE